ncbi:MAG: tryptophan 2,3-dioxygenase [Cyclobacteriaceae bacterium]|nr:tryptophan 2,3-dioxygenase [Cyclobacteriaceae bacterium]MCH8516996.1 tryptophan 2,3-dioxygenase [Cyclobacteriaceae bacterium]
MSEKDIKPEILEKIKVLEEKYSATGQDLSSYLDGLIYADYTHYWDYIHLDTLLSLQKPKTSFPDEQIFIIYHQITELYFKLILSELKQLIAAKEARDEVVMRLQRINRYFQHLTDSFDVMREGMDPKQFLKFRMSLLPASGFQSAQYRMIEFHCAPTSQLLHESQRERDFNAIEEEYDNIYWKHGATELASGKKTFTLKSFEAQYDDQFIELIKQLNGFTIHDQWQQTAIVDAELRVEMRKLDALSNIFWPLVHYKSAVRYLQQDPQELAATGGTNWQKYLPPRFQRIIFFPKLWSEEERSHWGKQWVMEEVLKK